MRVALKIDVLSVQGACSGVPMLLRLLERYQVRASFAVATGTAGDSWLGSLGVGTVIERRAAAELRAILSAGHEVGFAAQHPRRWVRRAAHADAAWTRRTFGRGVARLSALLGQPPAFGAAAGWQLNPTLLQLEQEQPWPWCSDTRGRYPFLPVLRGVRTECVQIPTTLPTLGEVLASGAATADNVHEYLYAESRHLRPGGHVFSADAGQVGLDQRAVLEKLLVMWKGQDGALRPLGQIYDELDRASLARHRIGWGELPGHRGHLAMQSVQVPND
jgi:peptidoglycan/xylan/chitin deacetylase (PgdA/CDA1 family)